MIFLQRRKLCTNKLVGWLLLSSILAMYLMYWLEFFASYDQKEYLETLRCNKNSRGALKRALKFLSEDSIIKRTQDCESYFSEIDSVVDLRANVPMAYGIAVHHDAGILETFLSSNFRPVDSYCIHVDLKSDEIFKKAIKSITNCYQQKYPTTAIFLHPKPINVTWGKISVLDIDLLCMEELRDRDQRWKVFLNPAGSEIPIKTASETVEFLTKFNLNIVDSEPFPQTNRDRIPVNYTEPPHDLVLRKGSKGVALKREMVEYILDDPVPKSLRQWLEPIFAAEEHFYSTLAFAKEPKGPAVVDKHEDDRTCVKFALWMPPKQGKNKKKSDWGRIAQDGETKCHGKTVRNVCNFAITDLDLVNGKNCIFANKFNMEVSPLAVLCQAKILKERMRKMLI